MWSYFRCGFLGDAVFIVSDQYGFCFKKNKNTPAPNCLATVKCPDPMLSQNHKVPGPSGYFTVTGHVGVPALYRFGTVWASRTLTFGDKRESTKKVGKSIPSESHVLKFNVHATRSVSIIKIIQLIFPFGLRQSLKETCLFLFVLCRIPNGFFCHMSHI